VVAVDGGFGVVGAPGRQVTWARVAEFAYRGQGLPAGAEPGLEATRFFSPEGEVWSAGAFVVSVRIDRDTGTVTPERIVWLDDAGTIVNPLLADGQLEGSLAQGWGQVMMEAAVLDRDGHLLSGTLMDYAVPRADDVPHAEIGHAHTPSPNNPLGAKGIGERDDRDSARDGERRRRRAGTLRRHASRHAAHAREDLRALSARG